MSKTTNNFGKITLLISMFLVIVNFASAIGVTYPQPQNIELKPGESSYFSFQIQSDDFALVCVPVVDNAAGLEFAFNPKYEVEANQRYNVRPQIIVPKQTGFGEYKASFCIECSPALESGGSKIIPRVCNLPVSVDVVSDRTRTNMFDEKGATFIWVLILVSLAIAIVILASVVYYLVRHKRR